MPKNSPFDLSLVKDDIALALDELHRRLFTDEMRLTLIVRKPGNPECELVVTADDMADVVKVVERSIEREAREGRQP